MATITDEPVQGEVVETDTGTPSVPEDDASGSTGRNLGDILSGMYPDAEAVEGTATPPQEPESEPAAIVEPGTPPSDDKSAWDSEQWAQYVSGNLRRISEVPGRERAAVNERAYQLREEQLQAQHQQALASKDEVARQALVIANQRFEERMKMAPLFNAIQQAQDPQSESYAPDSVIQFRREHPQEWASYEAFERGGWGAVDSLAPPPQQPQVTQERVYQAAAAEQLSMLDSYPEAKARVLSAAQGISASEDGLQQIRKLVKDAFTEAVAAERNTKEEPARKALEQRQDAADQRKAIPRPDVATNSGAQGGEDLDNKSYMDLIGMGLSQSMKAKR